MHRTNRWERSQASRASTCGESQNYLLVSRANVPVRRRCLLAIPKA